MHGVVYPACFAMKGLSTWAVLDNSYSPVMHWFTSGNKLSWISNCCISLVNIRQ